MNLERSNVNHTSNISKIHFRYWLAGFHNELVTVAGMVNGCDAPRNTDSQEDIYRVTSGHVSYARIGVLVLAGSHLARERVWNLIR